MIATFEHNATDLLEAYIPGDRRRALATGLEMPDRVRGAALFADISGFTPLTETLASELGPQRGAEELTVHLNRIFDALITELERFGGDVLYFSGDALTCWIDGDDGTRATACALAMQAAMGRLGEVVTPAGSRVRVAMKVSVAVGAARRFVVGDPDIQLIDVLAGRLVDALAAAELVAGRGEVVLDASAMEALGDDVEIAEVRSDSGTLRRFGVVKSLKRRVDDAPAPVPDVPLPESIVRPWLLPGLYERLQTGEGELVAELRAACPLFVSFGGIDYDRDDDAIGKLDDFVRRVQQTLALYGGSLLNLTLGDKGAYLSAVFGPPLAHEDDASRAAAAALALRDLAAVTPVRDIRIGITYGRLRSGTCGSRGRQTFTCLGDAVNLAARLMSKAPIGQILVSEPVRRLAGDQFEWEAVPPLVVKGKSDPVHAHALVAARRHAARPRAATDLPIIGRQRELETLASKLDEALAGRSRIVAIVAEAGVGKSRLIGEFAPTAERQGAVVARGECQSYGTNTAYLAWRPVWSTLFRLDDTQSPAEQARNVEESLSQVHPALVRRAPLLAGLLDVRIPDNDLTAGFEPKLRKTSLEGLLVDCLRAQSRRAPIVLVLEDCQWIDSLSRDLLAAIARSLSRDRVLLVLSYRPNAGSDAALGVERLAQFDTIALAELEPKDASRLIGEKFGKMFGAGAEPPPGLVKRVIEQAQGNPFYIEELLTFIGSQGISLRNEAAIGSVEIPESLHRLILGRIDRLDEPPRRTLKVASVVGPVFRAPMLCEIHPDLGSADQVRDHLRVLGANDLVALSQEAEQVYGFRHRVTQEVVYESLPFAVRSTLHGRIGAYIERAEPDAIERNLDLLAHHYGRSGNVAKKCEYLQRAGDAAQAAYANSAAIDYFERLAPLVADEARVDLLLKLGRVLELVGEWHRAEKVENEALQLAQRLDDRRACASCETALAEVARKQGRYDEAVERLDRAAHGFGELGDEAGLGRVLHLAGTVAAQRGDYEKATENYEASLAIRERLGDKASMSALLSNLGIVVEYGGDIDAARRFHERALALRTEIGDRWGIAVSTNNLGLILAMQKRFDDALSLIRKSIQLSREVGDGWLVAIGHNNLGNTTRGLGDYDAARVHYGDSLRAYHDFDDRWAMAILLEDIGVLAALCGDAPAALELVGAADALRAAIGSPRAPPQEEEIGRQLAAVAEGMAEDARTAYRERGRSLDLGVALERALAFCEGGREVGAESAGRQRPDRA